jgi:hypothetical protein
MKPSEASTLAIAGQTGTLRWVPRGEGEGSPQWLWEGHLDGPGLAALIRHLMRTGSFPCDLRGVPYRGSASSCWYDAGGGAVVLELAGPPERLA